MYSLTNILLIAANVFGRGKRVTTARYESAYALDEPPSPQDIFNILATIDLCNSSVRRSLCGTIVLVGHIWREPLLPLTCKGTTEVGFIDQPPLQLGNAVDEVRLRFLRALPRARRA